MVAARDKLVIFCQWRWLVVKLERDVQLIALLLDDAVCYRTDSSAALSVYRVMWNRENSFLIAEVDKLINMYTQQRDHFIKEPLH